VDKLGLGSVTDEQFLVYVLTAAATAGEEAAKLAGDYRRVENPVK